MRPNTFLLSRSKLGHLHFFSRDIVLDSLRDCGYKIIDHFYNSKSLDTKSKTPSNFLARLPRKLLFRINEDLTVRVLGGYSLLVLAE